MRAKCRPRVVCALAPVKHKTRDYANCSLCSQNSSDDGGYFDGAKSNWQPYCHSSVILVHSVRHGK